MSLKFIALSGTTGVTQNLYIYETDREMMIVDCGIGFPDIEMRGVDLVIPDFTYIIQNKNKLKGIIVSQGHEDHQGALPFLLAKVSAPVYAPKLTAAFIQDNLKDRGTKAQVNIYDPDKDVLTVGSFKVTPFRVTHSVPDTLGFTIDTPEGRVMHVAESKFDDDPMVGKPFDREKAKSLASKGILFLASDCLGSNRPGRTPGERIIESKIEQIVKGAKKTVFFSSISSNIGRIQQAINVAQKYNRKVVLIGRSITKKSQIAVDLGYLKYKKGQVIQPKHANNLPRNQVMYIIAGSFGQVGSSLFRVATGEHRFVTAEEGDTAILASDPGPPYSKENIDFIVDSLIDMNIDTHYYDLHEGLHVSGHGNQDDIVELFDIAKPKHFIPLGGTIRFMDSYRKLAQNYGADPATIFELKPGEGVEFSSGKAVRTKRIPVKPVLIDGLGIGDVGKVVLQDRKTLSQHGVAIALIQVDFTNKKISEPEIISRGFVFEKADKQFLEESARELKNRLERVKKLNKKTIDFVSVDFLTNLFFKKTGRRPMILPVVVEV